MAGDWIKWCKGLASRREVVVLASRLGRDRHEIAGRLMVLWEWCDDNVTESDADGVSLDVSLILGDKAAAFVDALLGLPGMAESLASPDVRWIEFRSGGRCVFPNLARHNGTSAKTRAYEARKKAKQRQSSQDASPDLSRKDGDISGTREEKRRIEKKKDNPPPPPPQQSAPLVPSQPVPRTPEKREGGEGGIEKDRPGQDPGRIAEAETAVRTAGVNRFREAIQIAIGNGMTVDGILAVVDTFNVSPGKWGPPALHERLTKPGAADFAPHEGWVDPLPEWQGKQRRAAQGPKPPTTEEQAAAAADRAELDRLEAAHGATLDGMTAAERLDLLPADQAMVRRLLSRDRGPPRGLARQTLLRLLDERQKGSE